MEFKNLVQDHRFHTGQQNFTELAASFDSNEQTLEIELYQLESDQSVADIVVQRGIASKK